MINDTLIWFLLLPVFGAISIWWFSGKTRDVLPIAAIYLVGCAILVGTAFFVSSASATSDVEVWNGQVVSKDRRHASYLRSYQCNCSESCSGTGNQRSCTTTCQTCYEDRYTVTHDCATTIGTFTIQHLDSGSRAVYNTPDPARWLSIRAGDPVSTTANYTNYVQAVPESLFKPSSSELKKKFMSLVPPYPDKIYDFYRINRFLTPGYSSPDAAAWNADISEMLKTRGPKKQVNAVVVIAKTDDPNYVYALRDVWQGANKNDVVLVIGSAKWPNIDFVEVISWTKRELFKVQLRDEVMALGTIQRQPIMEALARQIDTNFERRHMREFEYLKAEIDPPLWLLVALVIAIVSGAGGLIYAIKRNSVPFRRF